MSKGVHVLAPSIQARSYREEFPNLVMYRLPHEKKNYGFTPNLDFNPLPTRFNLTEFLRVCSTSGEKRTSKHGISTVLKLDSIEYQKRGAFLAAL